MTQQGNVNAKTPTSQFDPVSGTFSMNQQRYDTQSVYSITSGKNLVPIRTRQTYFKKTRKNCGFCDLFLLLTILVLSTALFFLSMLYMRSKVVKFCNNENCLRIAASLKESMDMSIDPCIDFYKFTCGRWPQSHPIPENGATNSWFSERSNQIVRVIRDLLRGNITAPVPWAVIQAKTLYRSCLDIESLNALGLVPVFNLLKELDVPRIPAAITRKRGDFMSQIARIKRVLGKDIFFGLDVYPDPKNRTRNLMIIDTPSTETPFPIDKELQKYLWKLRKNSQTSEKTEEEGNKATLADKNYILDVIREVVSNGSLEYRSCKSRKPSFLYQDNDFEDITDAIYELSEIFYRLTTLDNQTKITEVDITDDHYLEIDTLQMITDEYVKSVNSTLVPRRIWRPFLEGVFDGILTLNQEDKVFVANMEYLQNVALVISSTDEILLETVVWWSVVDILTPFSSKNLREIWFDYLREIIQVDVPESRSLSCAKVVNNLMGMAVSWLLVDPLFHQETGPKVEEMLEDIKAAFAMMVLESDWMERETKFVTLEKNRKMTSLIGYPRWLFEEGEIDEYYKSINLTMTEFLGNMVQLVRSKSLSHLSVLHQLNPDNETEWVTDPTDVNAFHTFQANQITVPAGILQFPFYDLGLEALNYGAIGAVLGHELTHGFDNSGRQYDSDGNVRQWWTNQTIAKYNDRTKCFVDQYSSYYEEDVDEHIDGQLTLGENIADNSGLREAILAYKRWKSRHGQEPLLPGFTNYTHEQLLFLGFSHLWCESYTPSSLKWILRDSHSPSHIRLLGVLQNSPEFSSTWKCPSGSKMNPVKKCRLW